MQIRTFPLTSKKTPAVPRDTDWRDYKGEVNTALIGVPIPKGAFVIDLDTYKGVKQSHVEDALGCKLDWINAALQDTPSKGTHYAFRVPVDAQMMNYTNALGVDGFDTRAAGKGYIATGEGYEDLTLFGVLETLHDVELLPELPSQAILKLSKTPLKVIESEADDSDDLFSMVQSTPLDLSDDDVADYMAKLTPDHSADSTTWLRVAAALRHQYGDDEKGWELFDTFSQLAPHKYDARENKTRYFSFKNKNGSKPITFATVIDLVGGNAVIKHNRFERLTDRVELCQDVAQLEAVMGDIANENLTEIDTAILLKKLSAKFNQVTGQKFTMSEIRKVVRRLRKDNKKTDFFEDYVFLTSTGEYMHRETKEVMGPRSFDVAMGRNTPPNQEGMPQSATTYVNNLIDCVYRGMYAPAFDDIFYYDGIPYFNTYRPNSLRRVKMGTTNIVERVIGHIRHLLPNEYEASLVINYLAHNVQFAGHKLHWTIILQGVQGDGKSFLAEMMKRVMGDKNCLTIGAEALDEKFTAWAEGHCMIFFEELKLDNYRKYETLNKLKPYITNPTVSVRKMRTDTYEVVNTTNYFAFTNHKDSLPIDDTDRRYCVLYSQWQSKAELESWMNLNEGYYHKLYEDMRNHTGEILDWLMSHEIPDWFKALKRAPHTEAKQTMIDMSRSNDFYLLEDAINQNLCEDINDEVVNITKLAKLVKSNFIDFDSDFPKTKRIKNLMMEMGYHHIGVYKSKERFNQVIYAKDHRAKASDFKCC